MSSGDCCVAGPAVMDCETRRVLAGQMSPFPNLFKIAHVNAQSLRGHIDEFREIFQDNIFNVIMVSESWLKPASSSAEVVLPGYTLLRNDRLYKNGGGVAIYIKSCHKFTLLHCSEFISVPKPEFMFIEVNLTGTIILLGLCYRPPKIGYLSDFEHALVGLMSSYSHVIVAGDFNTDLLGPKTFDSTYLTDMFYTCNMTLLPLNATHFTGTSATLLDIIAVSDPAHVVHHGQIPAPGLSSHDLVYCVYAVKCNKSLPRYISFRNYRNLDYDAFMADVQSKPWHEIVSLNSVDEMVREFNKMLVGIYDKHAPILKKRVTRRPAPWITKDIRQLMSFRDACYRRSRKSKDMNDLQEYRKLRNRVKQEIRNSKIRYSHVLFNTKSSEVLWRNIKNLGIGRTKTAHSVEIPLDKLNSFFIAPLSINDEPVNNLISKLKQYAPVNNRFTFSPVHSADVVSAIGRLKSDATGVDGIPIKFIKSTIATTLPLITRIFNESLQNSSFPNLWKRAFVCPINKTTVPSSPADYRPISILPALSKCLERVVYLQLTKFLEKNHILSPFQSGFRPGSSTATALIHISDEIRLAMDRRELTILTLFDFSKAFDCVNHSLLLLKLQRIGLSPSCITWIQSYLSGREQCVRVGDSVSCWGAVTRGVPQGSVLGPLLFSIYIDDISSVLKYCSLHLYADDLQIYLHFKINDKDNAVQCMNSDIRLICSWAEDHGLKLNKSKTQAIIIGYSRLMNGIDMDTFPRLRIDDDIIEYYTKVRNLGLTINNRLTWNDYVAGTCNRVFAGVHTLKKMKDFLPFSIRVLLVKTLIMPYFTYCDTVVSDMTVELANKLQRAQNYCVRFVYDLARDDRVSPYYTQISLLKLDHLRSCHILILLHGILKTGVPTYLSKKFQFAATINKKITRNSSKLLIIPRHRTAMFNKSFLVTACRLWNSLPDSLKEIESRARFAGSLKKFYTCNVSS